ncbi:MAG: hypothetical protein H6867_01685 [Rhodospirillales bacterium]|nr:hypothetical protein [Rhodospirillales bacterium]MCB9997229.1 hypothetical protein [Rhodospirillales bacterium]
MSLEENNKPPVDARRHFFIAVTDNKYMWTKNVLWIKPENDRQTRLVNTEYSDGIVDAPIEVVREVFREHGYEFVLQDELKQKAEQLKLSVPSNR